MTEWHEEDHPRDDDGKFTFKNGGNISSDGYLIEGKVEKTDFPGTTGEKGDRGNNIGDILGNILMTVLNPTTIKTILGVLAVKYTASELKKIEEALYSRYEQNTEGGNINQTVQAENSEKQKMQNRADIVYGSDEEYNKLK
mgnify:CR=1 FL=1